MTTLKKIDQNIKLVASTAEKVNQLVHETACMIVEHSKAHGDCSRAQVLVMALPASFRREALIAWFAKYSPIVVKNSENWDAKLQPEKLANGDPNPLFNPYDLTGGKKEPFWDIASANRETPIRAWDDIVKRVENLAKSIERDIENGRIKPEDVASAKKVAETLEGLHFSRTKRGKGYAVNVEIGEPAEASNDTNGQQNDEQLKERAAA